MSIFADGFKTDPYWWDAAPRPPVELQPLPTSADVVIVGSGYTGLSAGLALARAGRKVAVIEADVPGYGASSRNAGACGRTFRFSFSELVPMVGIPRAIELVKELYKAHDFAVDFITREDIACHLERCGRYIAAASPKHFAGMKADIELRRQHLAIQDQLIAPEEQDEYATFGARFGAKVVPDWHGLHPGLYQLGLLALANRAGVAVHSGTQVTGIRREGRGFEIATDRGVIPAREAIVGTNGYTGKATPYLQRRVVPFPAFMAATEPLGAAAVNALLPGGQIYSDSLENMFYIRKSPDGERMLFGGLTGSSTTDMRLMGQRLHAELVKLIPAMSSTRLTHVWTGKCSANFSMMPHIGVHDGVHYAMGYAFAGVSMGTYFGSKLAKRIIGDSDGATAFDAVQMETRPYYWGRTWFLPLAKAYIDIKDRMSL